MIYFHIPVLMLLVSSLVLYLVTVVRLSQHNKQTRAVRQSRRYVVSTTHFPDSVRNAKMWTHVT